MRGVKDRATTHPSMVCSCAIQYKATCTGTGYTYVYKALHGIYVTAMTLAMRVHTYVLWWYFTELKQPCPC